MKKGQGISMSMLVVMSLAILVLMIVALFFSGAFKRMGLSMLSTTESMAESEITQAQMQCNQRCSQVLLENASLTCRCDYCGDGVCQDSSYVGPEGDLGETAFICSIDC